MLTHRSSMIEPNDEPNGCVNFGNELNGQFDPMMHREWQTLFLKHIRTLERRIEVYAQFHTMPAFQAR